MSGAAGSGGAEKPGSSKTQEVGGPYEPTGIPVVDTAAMLGPPGLSYEDEFNKLKDFLRRSGNVIGPAAPVIFVHHARSLFVEAKRIVADKTLMPYDKCLFLFQIFDALVLAYKNLSFVYSDVHGTRSVYGYSELALKGLLSRIEAMVRQVAVSVHDAYTLTALNDVVVNAEQRLSQVQSDQDMMEFFRSVSDVSAESVTTTNGSDERLPRGVERYGDPYPEVGTLLERLYATNAQQNYVREFHDCMFLIATSNAPAGLSGALETRLADKDRNVVLFEAPGDRLFASSMCASAIAFLRKKLYADNKAGDGGEIKTYRINYARLFSKYRGESERNFDDMMEWIKNKARSSDKFRIFWFPDIENLMSPRSGNDQEHITAIKNSMLQHMDVFNKDRTLRSFLLLFNAAEGALDSAFSRRLETVIKTPVGPLADPSIAAEALGAELARYHINVTDELADRLALRVGTSDQQTTRIGGFAQVQATLRDLYVNQKLVLSHDVQAIDRKSIPGETLHQIFGRYLANGSHETLYDLDERPVIIDEVDRIAFSSTSRLAANFAGHQTTAIKYNPAVPGDPKGITEKEAARTVFFHDV